MQRLLFALALWLPAICPAQLTGQFQFQFTNDLPVWDVTGVYAQSDGTLDLSNTLEHSLRGAIRGSTTARLREALTDITAAQSIEGRVSGSSGNSVALNASGSGQFSGRALGRNVSGPFKGTLSFQLDPIEKVVSGTVSAEFCMRGFGCRTLATNISFALPEDVTGAWTLALDIGTTNNAVRGTATAELSNGRMLAFVVRGRFRPDTGATHLRLKGVGPSLGLRLQVQVDGSGSLQSLRGKLLGQKLVYP